MKKALVLWLCACALGFAGLFFAFRAEGALPPDAVALNDAVMTALAADDPAEVARTLSYELGRSHAAMDEDRRSRDARTLTYLCILLGAMGVAGALLLRYCERGVLAPFRRLRRFARNVAAGNLDIPLEMDRRGSFGAFTESFDLMREELRRAREGEREASRSKKELVAQLSHDIKTPVASIQAVAELMMAKSLENAAQLEVILAKAGQIDLLITNLFHATLEELEQLKIAPEPLPSTALYEMVRGADYDRRATIETIPECMVTVDPLRLSQVFDNVVSNSYKYAGTAIRVTARLDGPFLCVAFRDAGPGVSSSDLPLLFEKFYRGGNAAGKGGSGLGLYIAKRLMNRMGGDMRCTQDEDGFAVQVIVPL